MRTTLTLDPDVFAKARKLAVRMEKPMKETINAALRIGLEQLARPAPAKPYRTVPRAMGLRPGYIYDNVSELLAVAEGEEHR